MGKPKAAPRAQCRPGRWRWEQRVAEPLITLEGVGLSYGSHVALRSIDLSIASGECVALVGANGSGKSTLLRVLHGLLKPNAGLRREGAVPAGGVRLRESAGQASAVIAGRAAAAPSSVSVGAVGPRRAVRFAMLFQRPFLLRLSVQGNVRLGLWLAGVRGAAGRARCVEALHRVGLVSEARRPARALSGGQQQRLALARVWALQPDVLLVDEPTASLDPSARREVEALLAEFAGQGMTLLIASHNLGQVKRLAGRVIYLEHGRVLADLPAAQFFDGEVPPEARLFLKGELPW
ncbi:MAG: phosphate ABC transporter ATP-binding protein [Methylibium sp.]|nr:phosphate ABC transporter ATP-binding protein [Methylibium sp.]